jgi:hypothetical protein
VARKHAIEHLMDLAGYFSGFRENKVISKRTLFETDQPEVLYASDQNNCNDSLVGVAVLTSYNAMNIP